MEGSATAAGAYARYIGRVGALAVALGVGVAVTTGQGLGLGVARADESSSTNGPSNEAPANPGAPAADAPGDVDATPQLKTPSAPVGGTEEEGDPADDDPHVPVMNYSGGVNSDDEHSVDTEEDEDSVEPIEEETPPAPPAEEVTAPTASSGRQGQDSMKGAEGQDNSTTPTPRVPGTGVVDGVVEDLDVSTTPDSDPTELGRMTVLLDEDVDAGMQTMMLSTTTAGEDSARITAQAEVTQARPADALMGIPGAVVNVASAMVAALLSPFLAPGPVAPAQPPLLFALLAWVQREIQRAFFNRTPDAVVDTVTTSEDTPKLIDVLGNDTDVEDNPIRVTSFTQPAHGTVVQNPDGSFTYTPAANFNGTDTFTYTVRDQGLHIVNDFVRLLTGGGPRTDTATVNITVTAVNDGPLAVDDVSTTAEDSPVSGNVLTNDTDIDTPASGLSAALGTGPAKGTATVNANGSYTYTPNTNFNGTDTFTYTVSDGALTDTGTVTITVAAVNDAPVANNDTASTIEDTAVSGNVLANDTDPDGETLTAAQISGPTNGSLILNANGSYTYTPNVNFTGVDTFSYRASDGTSNSTTATVTITITVANTAPAAVADPTVGIPHPVTGAVSGLINVVDADGDELTYTVIDGPVDGTVTIDPETGTYTYTPNQAARLRAHSTPTENADSFTVAVSDDDHAPVIVVVDDLPISPAQLVPPGPIRVGDSPFGVAISPDGTRAYVPNAGDGTVTVIDTTTNTVVGDPIAVGDSPIGVAITPDGTRAYVTNAGDGTVTVIDTTTNTVVDEPIPVGEAPIAVAISPDGGQAYVVGFAAGSVTVIDTASGDLVAEIPVGNDPVAIAVSADGTRVYVTNGADGTVTVIATDPATGGEVIGDPISVGDSPIGVAVSPDGTQLFVVDNAEDSVWVIDADSGVPIAFISVGGAPFGVAVSGDGTRAYVTNGDGTVTVIATDPATGGEVIGDPIPVGNNPTGVAVSPDGTRAYVTNGADGTVTVIATDPATGGEVIGDPIPVGEAPIAVAISPDGAQAYVVGLTAGSVTVIDTASGDLVAEIPVGNDPAAIAFSADGTRAYVTNFGDGTVTVIATDPATGGEVIGDPIAVGDSPVGVAVSPDGTQLFVVDNAEDSVWIIDADSGDPIAFITVGGSPFGVAVSRDGTRAYVTNGDGTVTVIATDPATGGEVIGDPIPVGNDPTGVAISPDGTRAYVTNRGDGTVTVIATDPATGGEVIGDPIPVGNDPVGVAVSPDGSLVYVTNMGDGTVSVIDATTRTIIGAPIPVGDSPFGVAVSPDGTRVYNTNRGDSTVTVISLVTVNAPAVTVVMPDFGVGDVVRFTIPGGSTISSEPVDGTTLAFTGTATALAAPQLATTGTPLTPDQALLVPIMAVLAPGPVAAQPPLLWALLSAVLREIQRTFFNRPPTVNYDPTLNSQTVDGVVTGDLNAVDPEDDRLTYTVTQAPQHGSVVIHTDGTFTYTPDPDPANAANADAFVVTVSDTGGLFGRHSVQETIEVTVDTAPRAVRPPTVGAPNPFTGVVTGSVGVADPDGDELTYTVIDGPADGTVTFDADTGTYTYTPTQAARIIAGSTPDAETNSFTVAVTDGEHPPVVVPVNTIPVSAAQFHVIGDPLAIPVGERPDGVAVSPDGTRAYVVNRFDGIVVGTVSVIDTATNTVIGDPIPVGHGPFDAAVSPDGAHVYVTDAADDTVSVIDTETNQVIGVIPVGDGPLGVAFSPDGAHAYVTLNNDHAVAVIDTETKQVVGAPIPVGEGPRGIAVSSDGTRAYVANTGDGTVSVIDIADHAVVGAPIPVGGAPISVAVSPDGAHVYVLKFDDTVSVIDTAAHAVVGAPIPVGNARDAALSPDGSLLYVANAGDDTVVVIDTATRTVIGDPIPVGDTPFGVAVSPDGTHLYVTNQIDETISVIEIVPA